jgi:hypothetical protein
MPTAKEEEELLEGCVWEWTNNYDGTGVAGRVGFSKTNSNIIFLPAAGYISGEENSSLGSEGFYWSSSRMINYFTQSSTIFSLDNRCYLVTLIILFYVSTHLPKYPCEY